MPKPWSCLHRRQLLTLLLFLAAWFPIQGLSYAAEPKEYLVNGGFEDASGGIPSHWSAYNATFTQVDSPKRSGGFAGALGPASGGSVTVWAYQTVPDIAPGAYRLSGYVWKNDPHVSAVLLRIRWQAEDGSQIGIIDSPQLTGDSPSFQFLSTSEVSAPANARTASIRILLTNGSAEKGVVYVEDLSFQGPVPSPPTPTHTATSVPSPTTVPPTATPTVTLTFTRTPTAVPSVTASPTLTRTPTPRPTATPTRTLTPTPTLVPVTQASPGEVLINEFQFDPIQGGVDAPHEWVELYNRTDHTITLQGWGLRDNQERDTIPSLTLPAGGFAIVAASSSFTANFPGFSGAVVLIEDGTIGNGLSNQGDRLVLEDGAGQIIDQLSYGSDASFFNPLLPPIAAGHSYERRFPGLDTDQAADFCENPSPSPGHASPCQGTPTASATPSPLPTSTPQPAPTIVAAAVTPSASFTATVSPVTPTATLISEVLAIMVEASPTAGNLVETRQSASASATSPKELQAVLIAGALLVAVAGWVSVQWWRRNSLRGR